MHARRTGRLACLAAFWILNATMGVAHAQGVRGGAKPEVTHADLQPNMQARCVICHQGAAAPLGLRLDSLAGLLKGSSRAPVVKAGDPAGSELMRRIKGQNQPRMPMTGPPWLSEGETARFERWIAAGLPAGPSASAGAESSSAPTAQPPARLRPAAGEPPTWAHVAPIFATRCAKCHSPQGLMGPVPEGVLLNSYEGALAAGDRARIVPGQPAASELVLRIEGSARPRMPFDGPSWLADDEVALIRDWIAAGARDSTGQPASVPAGARIRLRGVLSADGTLDGLVPPSTSGEDGGGRRGGLRERTPAPGDGIELRGTLRAYGQIDIDRLRRR